MSKRNAILLLACFAIAVAVLVIFTGQWKPAAPGKRFRSAATGPTASTKTAIAPAARSTAPGAYTSQFSVPVLMYHRISDLSPKEQKSPLMRDLTVSPAHFDEQLRYLREHGFTGVLASEVEDAILNHTALPEKAVCITMDDGYRDNFESAFPILQRYQFPATIFLVTATLDTAGHLTWDDVHTMRPHDVGYGSHSVTHADLTTLGPDQLDYELRESKRVLENHLLERISAVAYPSGKYNATVAAKAKEVGYTAGWKKGGGPVRPGSDPYLLPRVRVNGNTTMEEFRRKVGGLSR